jgi:ligand-binding sensor domain-containing protein/tRNA A-37 threonylcarbamoyl transferase component Bud32
MDQYIGKRLGSYQILEQIGQGGMATIFKAYQPSMDRYVAVKILPSHFTQDKTFVARFTQEARTLARLEHPHILPVHNYGEQEGITYLVMRYIDAGTLKDLIDRQGTLELDVVVRIFGQIGRALGYAHSEGVIHRDIKPSNVLIDDRGDAFLTDFGIAKLVAGTSQFTASGALVGTPSYMAPEQGMGQPIDHRCDIYAMGVMLYEVVTGQVPFEAETPLAVLLKHISDPLPPPRLAKPDLPESVERVILKAMAKAPDDRFQSAEEMVEALQKAVAGVPTEIALAAPAVTRQAAVPAAAAAEPPASLPGEAQVAAPTPQPPPVAVRRQVKSWLPIVGIAAGLIVIVIAALWVLPNLGGDAETTPVGGEPDIIEPTAATALSDSGERPAVVTGQTVGEWTNYTNGNFVRALARQGHYLWAGGGGGLVRWDLNDGSYAKFGIADGLPSNQVNDLLVDENGYLWIATDSGIGHLTDPSGEVEGAQSWQLFDEADGLDAPWVLSLFLDSDNSLWAATAYGDLGLNYYDGSAWRHPPIPQLPLEFPRPRAFARHAQAGLFVGLDENGLAHYDGSVWQVLTSADGLPGDQVLDLLVAQLDNRDVLLATFGGETIRFDLDTGGWETIPQLSGPEVYCLHQAEDGSLWFGGDGGATRYDPQTGDWRRFESGTDTIPSWAVTAIIDGDGGLWVGTHDGGVVFYNGSTWQTWATPDELANNQISDIIREESGVLWFTHPGLGLTRYDPAADTWQTFGEGEGALDWPSAPALDGEGHLWIGGYEELKWYDGSTWGTSRPEQLFDTIVFGIAIAPDNLRWYWTDHGLIRHDPAADGWTTFTAADSPVFEYVNAVHVAPDGTAWAGGMGGLVYYDGSVWRVPDATGDGPGHAEDSEVHDLTIGPDGALWAVSGEALYRLVDAQWSRFEWVDHWMEAVAIGPDGVIWAGDNGLGRLDPATGSWQTLTPADGLVNPWVTAILVTPEGVVWVGTQAGVSRFAPELD